MNLKSNTLLKGSAVVFLGTMTANIGSYLYHLLMGRILGPRGYGELSSLISLLYILGVPLLVIQTTLVKYFSEIRAQGTLGQAKTLFVKAIKRFFLMLVVFGLGYLLAVPMIADYLHLTSFRFPIWIYLSFILSVLTVVATSYLQGFQRFNEFSLLMAFAIISKLVFSLPFARVGLEPVLLAAVISGLVTFGLYLLSIRSVLVSKTEKYSLTGKEAVGYAIPTLLTLGGITSLYSTDIILARHYFNTLDGGIYAAVAVLGKVIFYATSAIGSVIFPIIAERKVSNKPIIKLVKTAVILVAGGSILVTAIYALLPGLITGVLFGSAYEAAVPYLFEFGVFMVFFSISYLLILVNLAAGKTGIWKVTVTIALVQIALISLYHNTIIEVIQMNIFTALLMLIGVAFVSRKLVINDNAFRD